MLKRLFRFQLQKSRLKGVVKSVVEGLVSCGRGFSRDLGPQKQWLSARFWLKNRGSSRSHTVYRTPFSSRDYKPLTNNE